MSTLIMKPNEYFCTLQSNLPRKWADLQPLWISQFARQRQSTETGRYSSANVAEDANEDGKLKNTLMTLFGPF